VFTQRGHPPGGKGWVQVRSGVALTLADGLIERQTNNVDIDEARAAAERLAEERA
jgi:ketosteroid isomerase-like protein